MIQNMTRHKFALAGLCAIILNFSASAQSFVRYAKPSDIGTKTMYADTILNSIVLPKGVFRVDNNLSVQDAAFELSDILKDPQMKLLKVYVCGSASPDGLWQENVALSHARTETTARFLRNMTGVPVDKIMAKSLNEDWDRLYDMVKASDIPYKNQVLEIIRTKTWGERKTALRNLGGGQVWRILLNDFFPQLRCVRITFYCAWDPTKPYLSYPIPSRPAVDPELLYYEEPVVEEFEAMESAPGYVAVESEQKPVEETEVKEVVKLAGSSEPAAASTIPAPATVTTQSVVQVPTPASVPVVTTEIKSDIDPWMMGFKTNLLGDAIVVPSLGCEIQIGKEFSFDLQGFYTNFNVFVPEDKNTNVYGFYPEFRWWPGGKTMKQGQFLGLHAGCTWYTLQWKDGMLYQNGPADMWEGNYHNAGNSTPAWALGLTYGYSLGLGRNDNWGLEFVLGVGYATYMHNTAVFQNNIWELVEHSGRQTHFGITRAGINLTYRFSIRNVNPSR